MTDLYKKAGERILLTRNMRGYTRESLAELAGISDKFLYEVENGKRGFSAIVLYSLSKALDVSNDYILTGKDNNNYDKKLISTLELFDKRQTEKLGIILKEIYELVLEM
ncbi:MAG: helix-turn-helix transcriptional regulator [Lachnospiraceae bacterium]|nr:helix-turn-helix transcriptional regulator [Lachnospiraceae bacterium]